MVSSSLDKSIKKALAKDTTNAGESGSSVSVNSANSNFANSGASTLPPDDKIQLLFPKCRPRSDYQLLATSHDTPTSSATDLISIASPSSHSITQLSSSQMYNNNNNSNSNNNNNICNSTQASNMNSKHLKLQSPLSPDHKKQQHQYSIEQAKLQTSNKHEQNDNYVETNPFRIGSNNRYFYTPQHQQQQQQNDSLFNNNNSSMATAASSNNALMHHYHYPPSFHQNYPPLDRNYFLEPDEIEHNPYMDVTTNTQTSSTINTIPSSILKTSPPETPPALTTTPIETSPLGSNRNLWDLSPIKSNTPTRIKTQSPILYSRPHRGSYKKLLASPVPIEEDLETGHYYYNNKKPYYQAPQTDSDSNEPATFNDVHEVEKIKPKASFFSKTKASLKHSESSDVIYADARKKDERKVVKSKSGSGIMEYDGSPRRFGMTSNDDMDYYSQSNYKYNAQALNAPSPQQTAISANGNYSSPSPPRPGFPQRIVPYDQRSKSPAQIPKSYSFDDQQTLSAIAFSAQQNVTTTSTLIPTTFINSSAYENPPLPQEKAQTIVEESESLVDMMNDDDEEEASAMMNASESKEIEELTPTANMSAFDITSPTENLPTSTFDYLYEFSETRKVLEEFFKCPDDKIKEFEKFSDFNESDDSLDIQYDYRGQIEKEMESLYGSSKQAASSPLKQEEDSQQPEEDIDDDNRDDREDDKEEEAYVKAKQNGFVTNNDLKENSKPFDYYLDSASRSSLGDDAVDQENDLDNNVNSTRNATRRMSKALVNNGNGIAVNNNNSSNNNNNNNSSYQRRQSKNFNYSPDTTDYDSESSMRYIASDFPSIPMINAAAPVELSGGPIANYARYCTSMPVLEDGLSSGHASDNENNNPVTSNDLNFFNKRNSSNIAASISTIQKQYQENLVQTHANNNIFYTSNNNSSSSSTLGKNSSTNAGTNGINNNNNNGCSGNNTNGTVQLLNNGDIESKVRSAQSPPNYHSYYGVRYDSKETLRYPDAAKETSRFDNNNKDINRYADSNEPHNMMNNNKIFKNRDPDLESLYTINTIQLTPPPPAPVAHRQLLNDAQFPTSPQPKQESDIQAALKDIRTSLQRSKMMNANSSPTPLFNATNASNMMNNNSYYDRTPVIPEKVESPTISLSPVWIPRSRDKSTHSPIPTESGSLLAKHKNSDEEDEEEIDTDLETDRLLGHQMLDDGFYDDKAWTERKQHRTLLSSSKISPKVNQTAPSIPKSNSSSLLRHGLNTLLPTSSSSDCCINNGNSPVSLTTTPSLHQSHSLKTSPALNSNSNMMNLIHAKVATSPDRRCDVDPSPRKLEDLPEQHEESQQQSNVSVPETNDLCNLDGELVDSPGGSSSDKSKKDANTSSGDKKKKNKNKEVLIEGVLFRARYLGSTQLVCEGQPTKSTRMMQAEEAVSRIKAPDGENQPSTEVDLFISTEKIMVLNTDLKEIMMDHALRTISYIADIGDLVVLMARRRFVPQDHEANSDSGTGTGGSGNVSGGSGGPTPPTSGKINRTPKMICHVFESEEAQFIAQSIGQAFQVAYMEFLKANGIEDHSFMKEMDYQEVLNSQEIFGDELEIFAKKELQKEVVVPKAKGEILGVVIVESGWGSMLPTVVIANLASNGAAARCGQLNIGDQIIAINGLSLVGLPLSQCQQYIKNTKNQTVVKFTVVPCAPVVEVKIKRPNTKYQLGFSVQNGVICSLLRGGIAERGGVRVGHRIIEINNQSVVAVPHEKIVNLLATSVGEILMKTMPTSMFRLLTGQENPIYI